MVIKDIISRNAILAEGQDQGELILVGSNIGVNRSEGDSVDLTKAVHAFRLEDSNEQKRLIELLGYVSEEDFEMSSKIIRMAEKELGKRLEDRVYLTLTDHLVFAVERVIRGISFNNQLMGDLKQNFPKELIIGKKALDIIRDIKKLDMPEDEAGYIALHIANAQGDNSIPLVETKSKVVNEIVKIVEEDNKVKLDEKTQKYGRFIMHLKFATNRYFSGEMLNDSDEVFFETIKNQFPDAHQTALKVFHHLLNEYSLIITNDELTNLTVNISQALT